MNAKELFKTMVRSFFIIATGIVCAIYLFCRMFYPDASLSLHDLGGTLLLAFFSDLPFLLFYSPRELSKREMNLRILLHLPILLAVVSYFSYLWGWIHMDRNGQVFVFLVLVLAIYLIVYAITSFYDKKLSDKLNSRLRERYGSK